MVERFGPSMTAAVFGAALVLALLALFGWPGGSALGVPHVIFGGVVGGVWLLVVWRRAEASAPWWWPRLVAMTMVFGYPLSAFGGTAALIGAVAMMVVAVAAVKVGADCIGNVQDRHIAAMTDATHELDARVAQDWPDTPEVDYDDIVRTTRQLRRDTVNEHYGEDGGGRRDYTPTPRPASARRPDRPSPGAVLAGHAGPPQTR